MILEWLTDYERHAAQQRKRAGQIVSIETDLRQSEQVGGVQVMLLDLTVEDDLQYLLRRYLVTSGHQRTGGGARDFSRGHLRDVVAIRVKQRIECSGKCREADLDRNELLFLFLGALGSDSVQHLLGA